MTPRYTLYYWPIPFRGHFIRYALAYAGTTWREAAFEEVIALKNEAPQDQPYPFMAPPVLKDHDTYQTLSQMPAILMDLGDKHDLLVEPQMTLKLICDASDILYEMTRAHGAQMWDFQSWSDFSGSRLPRWMQIHERVVEDGDVEPEEGYVWSTEEPSLGDLVLAALWHTMIDRLPPLRPLLREHAPALEGLVDRVASTPAVSEMLTSWTDCPSRYCGGQIEASLLDVLGIKSDG